MSMPSDVTSDVTEEMEKSRPVAQQHGGGGVTIRLSQEQVGLAAVMNA